MSGTPDQSGRETAPGPQRTAPTGDTARQHVPRPAPHYEAAPGPGPSAAVTGLTVGAAVLMMLSGAWNFLEGLAAVLRGSFFVVLPNYAYNISVVGWGWFHLILGVVVFAAGCALFTDAFWARVTGVVLVALSTIVNFIYIPYQPVWSIALIVIDLAVIWALLSPRRQPR
jgi:hypothetical protein